VRRHDFSSVLEVWIFIVSSDLVFSKGESISVCLPLSINLALLFVDWPNSRSFFMILSFLTARMLGRLPLSNSLNVFFPAVHFSIFSVASARIRMSFLESAICGGESDLAENDEIIYTSREKRAHKFLGCVEHNCPDRDKLASYVLIALTARRPTAHTGRATRAHASMRQRWQQRREWTTRDGREQCGRVRSYRPWPL
jgi:hypothetical protein